MLFRKCEALDNLLHSRQTTRRERHFITTRIFTIDRPAKLRHQRVPGRNGPENNCSFYGPQTAFHAGALYSLQRDGGSPASCPPSVFPRCFLYSYFYLTLPNRERTLFFRPKCHTRYFRSGVLRTRTPLMILVSGIRFIKFPATKSRWS